MKRVLEENEKVWITTEDYPDPILIYNFDWNDENAYYEYLRVHESLETELVKLYLKQDEIQVVNYKDSTIDCFFDYDGAIIRHIGRVAELNRGCALLGYIIEEPIIPGLIFKKVLWIVRNGKEIFRSEIAEEWTVDIPSVIHNVPYLDSNSRHYPPYFDLSGRPLNTLPNKGVYIQDGKKRVIR